MQTMLNSYDPVNLKHVGTLCRDLTSDGFPVRLYQHATRRRGSFAVQYGKQLDHNLSYAEACAKLGQALMHDFACRSEIDNDRD